MLKKIASTVSYLLNPLIMPTYGLLFILFTVNFGIPANFQKLLVLIVFSGTFVLPAAILVLFKYFKIINDVEMHDKNERIVPLIITFLLYLFTFIILRKLGVPSAIPGFVFASIISLVFTFFITLAWKISVHMIGIGGLVGLVFIILMNHAYSSNNIVFLSLTVLLSGMLGTSRIYLDAHTPQQVYSGFSMGMVVIGICTGVYMFF